MAKITDVMKALIDNALADGAPCLLGTATREGEPQISPKGSVLVHDDRTLAFWERSKRTSLARLRENPRVVIYYRNPDKADQLPRGAALRFYGTAEILEDGPVRAAVMSKVVPRELESDPDRTGAAILVHVERITDLAGNEL